MAVEVSIPSKISVKMVDASSLSQFELWGIITSVLCNFSVGFIVAAITNDVAETKKLLWFVSIVFIVFTIFAFFWTWREKKKMKISEKIVQMKAKV